MKLNIVERLLFLKTDEYIYIYTCIYKNVPVINKFNKLTGISFRSFNICKKFFFFPNIDVKRLVINNEIISTKLHLNILQLCMC